MPDDIDPQLPYIQLHRSVVQRASILSATLKMPIAQIIGSLALFWMELSDRRLLGRCLTTSQPMVAFPRAEVEGRLRLAFGQSVDLDVFILAGIVDQVSPELYRVKGMSRQLEVESKRLRLKAKSRGGSTPVGPDIGKRLEATGNLLEALEPAAPQPHLEEAFKAVPTDRRVDPLRAQKQELLDDYQRIRGDKYLSTAADWIQYAALRKTYAHEIIRARWQKGLQSTDRWTRISTLRSLPAKWNDLADDAPPVLRGKPPVPQEPVQKPLTNYTNFKGNIYANPKYPEPEDGGSSPTPGDRGPEKAQGGAPGGPRTQGLKIVG